MIAAAAVAYLAVAWRVLPWFIRRARLAPTYVVTADFDGWVAALFWPVTLCLFIARWNWRTMQRAVEARI